MKITGVGAHVVVFHDRVTKKPGNVSILLGHVIAREVCTFCKAWRGTPRAAS